MSSINTNGLDVNYPIPGQNNSSQGFRNNFTNIKQNLNLAANEISDLENKAVLKSALANNTLNNDMANTLIANASTLQFRNTMYNLGNAIVGEVLVNCSLGDVQYGNISGNVLLNFASWAPVNTLSTVKLQLGRSNNTSNFSISFPQSAVFNNNTGWALLENSNYGNNITSISFPYDVTQVNLTITSTDCGNTIFVEPTNRPFKTTQIQQRTPLPVGFQGDTLGTVAVDADNFYVCTGTYNATTIKANSISTTSGTNVITFNTNVESAGVVANMPVIFDTMFINGNSVSSFGNINAGSFYYVKTVSATEITISNSRSGATLPLTTQPVTANTYMDATFYAGTDIWKRIPLSSW